jgi:ABC-type multidrug transport system ATPase subunit
MTTTTAIDVTGMVKTFGNVRALDGLNLSVDTGEVHGFLGPNGAGKSTAIKVLLGQLRADAGSATLLGGDPWRDAVELHRRLAYVPGDVNLWPNLSGGEVIDLLARLRGGMDTRRRDELLERFELDPRKKGRAYSKGNRQKVAIVAALASDVELLIMDEPTTGLDPLMEAVFQDLHQRGAPARQDRAAVQPHPVRGGSALRPGEHHPFWSGRRDGHAVRTAAPDPDHHRGRVGHDSRRAPLRSRRP